MRNPRSSPTSSGARRGRPSRRRWPARWRPSAPETDPKGDHDESSARRLAGGVGSRSGEAARTGKAGDPGARRARCRTPPPADGPDRRGLPEAHGLDHPVVLLVREQLQSRLRRRPRASQTGRVPGRRVVRPERVPSRRRGGLSHLLHRRPRRRGARPRLDLPRPDTARPPGGVGGLTRGIPTDPAVCVVAPPRRVRPVAIPAPRARAMTKPVQIIGNYISPYVRKVLVFLDLKGIPYEIDPIVPFFGDDRFGKLSPVRRMRDRKSVV